MIGLVAAAAMVGCCTQPCDGIKDSGTTYMADALAPYIEKGELPGVVSMLYSDGVTETACLGYADVAAKRKITADDVYMQCSQTKGFCGGPRPWDKAREEASEKFFKSAVDSSGVDAYTGRMK